MKHLIILLFLLPLSLSAGNGVWEKRINLLDVDVDPTSYSVTEPTRTGQDTRDYSGYKGYVFLDYTRKEQSDLATASASYWRMWIKYKIVGDITGTLHQLQISYEGGNYIYSDFESVGTLTSGNFGIIITKVEGQYSLNSGSTWTAIGNAANSVYIPNDIDVRLELRSELWYNLNVSAATDKSNFSFSGTDYRAAWSYVEGADWYDFEWVFIDKKSDSYDELTTLFGNMTNLAADLDAAFDKKASTRVRVWGTHYVLDKAYPEGTLYFRVRSVTKFTDGTGALDQVKTGDWNYFFSPGNYGTLDAGDIMRYEITTPFESTKNWLYSTAFAEGGKSVSSVSFYDGSNRARQGITYNTSDNVSLVGESKFDYEGRQTISIIPAPVPGRQLTYRTGFNPDHTGGAFDEADYDQQNYLSTPVASLSSPATGSYGAAQYFSPNNSFTTDLFRPAIPDAGGYVFSQTIYRNDGSGRVERVGGVGADFQVNGDHAARTYYGSAMETELKRLFGENVSNDPSGYRKEMVRDANGQYSVTYYDKRGHVIATALSGNAPTNLRALEDAATTATIVTDLTDNNITQDQYSLVSEHTFLNGVENNSVTFSYDATGIVSQLVTSPVTIGSQVVDFGDLCSTCRYDLSIKILNQAGALVGTEYTADIDPTVACTAGSSSGAATLTHSFSQTLVDVGEYRIIKRLTVDVASMQTAFTNNLHELGLDDASAFIASYVQVTDLSGCFDNCDDYCTALKKLEYQQAHPELTTVGVDSYWNGLSDSERDTQIAACMATACNTNEQYEDFEDDNLDPINPMDYLCDGNRERMLQQISPGGVFYDNPSSYFWTGVATEYGNPATIGTGSSHPITWYQDPANYTDDMAVLLLHLHREYCHLQYCEDWAISANYSNQLLHDIQLVSWNSSETFFTNVQSSSNADPFMSMDFNLGTTELSGVLDSYLTDHQAQFTGDCSAPTSGNLFDYVEAVVDCIEAQDVANGNSLSADYYLFLRRQLFIGTYNNTKEELIKEVKTAAGCAYFTDYDAVFIGPRTLDDMIEEAEQGFSNMLNPSDCQQRALSNTHDWLQQLPAACLASLTSSQYSPAFADADLIANTNPTHLEQLFYNYSLNTCPENTYGWFYNPDPNSDPAMLDGETEYNAILSLLTTSCTLVSPLPFEVTPPPGATVLDLSNQQFSDCFTHFLALMNQGLAQLHACAPCTTTNVSVTSTTHPDLFANCSVAPSGNLVSGTLNAAVSSGTYTLTYTSNISACSSELLLYSQLSNTALVPPAAIDHLENPVKLLQYGVNPIIGLDVVLIDGTVMKGFIDVKDLNCVDPGSFTDNQSITDFDSIGFDLPDYVTDCISAEMGQAAIDAQNLYNDLLNDLQNQFLASLDQCLSSVTEHFTMSYSLKEYQYTLYYYDLAGNLVQTVPPQGVTILSSADANSGLTPVHKMETRYKYNGLNTLVATYTPDGGHTDFYLDKLYRVRYSQNARQAQAAEGKASYSKYDALGRVVEAGEFKIPSGDVLSTKTEIATYPSAGILDYTLTMYESIYATDASIATQFGTNGQENLRNAIGAILHRQAEYDASGNLITGTDVRTVISYSYDPHKNVKQVVSTNYQLAGLGHQHKKVNYSYDLISGNVNEVVYQKDATDEYRHRYHYDANNRLVRTFTSKNNIQWEMDAKYFYYLHGALARTELGHDKVQGTDYAYNLQGWLKGVNSATMLSANDLGKDGASTGLNKYGGIDAMGFQLGYFNSDYTPIGTSTAFAETSGLTSQNINPDVSGASMASLYNGNITYMATAIRKTDETMLDVLGNNYQYDQLQRIRDMKAYLPANLYSENNFSESELYRSGAYRESYTFDRNGNLKTLTRNGSGLTDAGGTAPLSMDNFAYTYYNDLTSQTTGNTSTSITNLNRLASVSDTPVTDANYGGDINSGQAANNYQYDPSGQLISDGQENISRIDWTVTGKVKNIIFTSAGHENRQYDLKFIYDPMDRRIAKVQYQTDAPHTQVEYTYYTYDASGNVMATYDRTIVATGHNNYNDQIKLSEHHIYGSSRIGTENEGIVLSSRTFSITGDVETGTSATYNASVNQSYEYTYRKVADKFYELTNHLGNVLAVVTDRKVKSTATVYTADVVSYSDYSPYGMLLQHRHGEDAAANYRYGFQGQEQDDEIKGEGNSLNYEYRMHDPRIGRFFAVDPLAPKYPFYTPYAFSGNRVMDARELEGLEPTYVGKDGQTDQAKSKEDGKVYNWTWQQDANISNKYDWSKGSEYAPTKEEFAQIDNHVYNLTTPGYDPDGDKEYAGSTKYALIKEYGDGLTGKVGSLVDGYKAGLYARNIDGVFFYVFATAGTDDGADGMTDLKTELGSLDEQIPRSIVDAMKIDTWVQTQNNGNHLYFSGHSLGGGLAAANAYVTGRSAVTFNAMGLSWATKMAYNLTVNNYNPQIDAYIISGEAVNAYQFAQANGTLHFVKPKVGIMSLHTWASLNPDYSFGMYDSFYNPFYNAYVTGERIRLHSLDRFLELYKK